MVVDSADADEPAVNMMLVTQKSAVLLSGLSATTSSQTSNVVSDFENQLSQQCQPNKIDVMTPELCAALDRAKVTNRNTTFILAAAFKSVGIDLSTLNLSYGTIYRARIKHRSNIAQDLKEEFRSDDRYVVHWDGKILPDIADLQSVDRLAVLLSVSGVDQLLGVPKADIGTAYQQALAVISTLNQWNIAPYVKAMCFDTAAVNTGVYKGTCVQIEKALGRKLVWLPCRHHVLEIVLRGVFEVFWTTTSGPNVPIFLRFKKGWDDIDQTKYKSGIEDETVASALNEDKMKIINFINDCLQMSQPRDDYRELLVLSLVFLGSCPTDTYTFKRPGAMHHARWMSQAIYSLKMFIFRDQFHLSPREIKSLRQVCIFVILFYIEAWYTATSAILAPHKDLELMKNLILNKKIDSVVS
ncbi:uncharacterized protein LOC123270876 [Cotesia glomerata]|uniref:uncharacterized protein LOC123270876 n=1 Tax=Cotesia glomerata TaxID=32391 RepID=UPI001D02A5D2|nr:uncharacterized protein LOC123270876 [Cotesia glomerata]